MRTVSLTVVALVLFCAFNCVFEKVHNLTKHEKTARTLLQLEQERVRNIQATAHGLVKPADLIMIGSSVIGHPFSSLDGEDTYFTGQYFVNEFRKTLGDHFVALNMGTDGAMISDSHLIFERCLSAEKAPNFVVLGVTPRDFCDHEESPYPCYSYQFKTLTKLPDFFDIGIQSMYLPRVEDKADFAFNNLFSLYFYRFPIQSVCSDFFKKLMGDKFADGASAATDELKQIKNSDRIGGAWGKSLHEYRKRYLGLNNDSFFQQKPFLDKFANLCKSRNIELLVVNMPLSVENRGLMPKGTYEHYRSLVARTLAENGTSFLDLGQSNEFGRDCFFDCAHLNASGARLVMRHIVEFIQTHRNDAL